VIDQITEWLNLVRSHVVASVVDRGIGSDDANVTVGTRSEIVENTRSNGTLDQLDGFRFGHVLLPCAFENRHGGETSGSHGGVVEFRRASVGMDLVDARAVNVAAPKDEGGADVSLVLEEPSF